MLQNLSVDTHISVADCIRCPRYKIVLQMLKTLSVLKEKTIIGPTKMLKTNGAKP
jgi:hypothetical protein